MIDQLHTLQRHLEWADSLALESLVRTGGNPAQALAIYAHVLGAERVWLARLKQEAAQVAVWPTLSLEECRVLAEENAASIARFLLDLQPADLAREVTYTNSAGQQFRSEVQDILLHVCLHGAYHRGQVALLIRGSGAEPEATDYIAFVRGAPAAKSGPRP